MQIETSPFMLTGPASPDDLVGRHDVLAALCDRAASGRFVTLTAPRRFGKTTLIHRLRRDAQESGDLAVVLVDLMGILTLDDLAVRLVRAWMQLPKGPVAKVAASLVPYISGISVAGGSVSLSLDATSGSSATLEAVLDVPRAIAERTGRRVLVVLDEFQEVHSVDRADAIIRSQIQHHTDSVSYLFAGSELSTMDLLFNESARPLYGQAEMIQLDRFDPVDLGEYVSERLSGHNRSIGDDALAGYLDFVDGHPQRSMLLADCMWALVAEGEELGRAEVSLAISAAVDRCRSEFERLADFLSGSQVRLLRLLAWGEPTTGAAAQRLGLSQGAARSAVDALKRRGVIEPRQSQRLTIVDPVLRQWVWELGERP